MDIRELQKQAYEIHKAKGWEDNYERNPDGSLTARQLLELICLVTDELDEAELELSTLYYVDENGKPCGEAVEIVDAAIRTLNIISSCGLVADDLMFAGSIPLARHRLVKSIRQGRSLEEIGCNLNALLTAILERMRYAPDQNMCRVFAAKMAFNATRPPRHGGMLA